MRYIAPICIMISGVLLANCNNASSNAGSNNGEIDVDSEQEVDHNTLSEDEIAAGWSLLFDGKSVDGWHNYGKEGPVQGWKVENGELMAQGIGGGDIVTNRGYQNFELKLEWKVSEKANSGIFFNVIESEEYPTLYQTGPEYQIIDEDYENPSLTVNSSGANYDMHAPDAEMKIMKPRGEFNSSRIVVQDSLVSHYLNGKKVVEYQLWTSNWFELVQGSKWKDYPGYGIAQSGKIGLQDHGNQIWFRNIKIRELQ